ncbi:hypothetical protein GW17_00025102 [Ensete ventricosum]|nr:hypothetical protein GW17_00025102 [Ensete ventricosum]
MIELAEDEDNETSEEALEPKEEAMEEDSQPTDYAVHALAGYSNPQMMKVGGLPKQKPITILVDTGSINNFLNSKVAARLALQIEGAATRGRDWLRPPRRDGCQQRAIRDYRQRPTRNGLPTATCNVVAYAGAAATAQEGEGEG